jgi:LysM repeat protein
MDSRSGHRSPARVIAPVALAVFAVAMLLVLTSGGGDDGGGGNGATSAQQRDVGSSASERRKRRRQRTTTATTGTTTTPEKSVYVVKQGDTLAGIAETTGVPVERLQELNPGLDQFSLVAGQRIKLR